MDDKMRIYQELTDLQAISGYEGSVRKYLEDNFVKYTKNIVRDKLGSIFAIKEGTSKKPTIMIAGHMDEVGAMVSNITEDRLVLLGIIGLFFSLCFLSCHGAQERAWEEAMEATRAKIQEDEFLSKNIHSFELERRQFIRLYIKPQSARTGFRKTTTEFTKIIGDELFAHEGNSFTELIVKGNLYDDGPATELLEARYTPELGVEVLKDRSMITM